MPKKKKKKRNLSVAELAPLKQQASEFILLCESGKSIRTAFEKNFPAVRKPESLKKIPVPFLDFILGSLSKGFLGRPLVFKNEDAREATRKILDKINSAKTKNEIWKVCVEGGVYVARRQKKSPEQ